MSLPIPAFPESGKEVFVAKNQEKQVFLFAVTMEEAAIDYKSGLSSLNGRGNRNGKEEYLLFARNLTIRSPSQLSTGRGCRFLGYS